jgi:hypothetical protein
MDTKNLEFSVFVGSGGLYNNVCRTSITQRYFDPGLYLPFMALVTIAVWYTIALFIRSFWQSLLLTMTLIIALILSTLQLMFWGLALVLLLTLGIESWYIYSSHEKNRTNHEPKNRVSGI